MLTKKGVFVVISTCLLATLVTNNVFGKKGAEINHPSDVLKAKEIANRASESNDCENLISATEYLARKGYPVAQFNMGLFYRVGICVNKSPEKSMSWYTKAAEQGEAHSQHELALLHGKSGSKEDEKKAAMWYLEAAKKGYAPSQYNYGVFCQFAKGGVPRNYYEAEKWYKKSAKQNYIDAQFNLGNLYEEGQVGQDISRSFVWYMIAGEAGDNEARFRANRLMKKMDTSDMKKAEKIYSKVIDTITKIDWDAMYENPYNGQMLR